MGTILGCRSSFGCWTVHFFVDVKCAEGVETTVERGIAGWREQELAESAKAKRDQFPLHCKRLKGTRTTTSLCSFAAPDHAKTSPQSTSRTFSLDLMLMNEYCQISISALEDLTRRKDVLPCSTARYRTSKGS